MITLKELQYVDAWASKTPMPGIEYSREVMKEIENCYNTYNSLYKDKEYNIIFSNGEEISFAILTKNLCHMLGIDYKNIKGDYFANYRRNVLGTSSENLASYELLELLIENSEKVIEHDNNILNRDKAINYYKSGIKCQIFRRLSNFDKFNFGAINYNPGDDKHDYSKEKVFFVASNEPVCPYFMMGIRSNSAVKDLEDEENIDKLSVNEDSGNQYFVTTLFAPSNPKEKFENQEVIIPTQLLVSDNNELKRMNATPEEKIQLLTMYKSIINEYNIPNRINIYGDYETMLNDLSSSKEKSKVLK